MTSSDRGVIPGLDWSHMLGYRIGYSVYNTIGHVRYTVILDQGDAMVIDDPNIMVDNDHEYGR